MLQIFADLSAMQGDLLEIAGEDYNHIKNVLRMKPGEELLVRNPDGAGEDSLLGRFAIDSFTEDSVRCRLVSMQASEVELPVRVLLFQGLPKADKMDLIVQKAVELGAAGIVPVEMHRSIVKLTGDKRRKRVARWQAIAEAAAKQSKRALIPEIHDIMTMSPMSAWRMRRRPGRGRFWNSFSPDRPQRSLSAPRGASRRPRSRRPWSAAPALSPWAGGSCGPRRPAWPSFPS